MFQELDHWFVHDFTPIWNWKWLCNKMASTGKVFGCACNLKKSRWCVSRKTSHLHLPWKTTLLERTDRQAGLIQTSDTGTWQVGFCGFFFFSTEWNKVSLQGKQTTLFFFFTDNKIQSFKKIKILDTHICCHELDSFPGNFFDEFSDYAGKGEFGIT